MIKAELFKGAGTQPKTITVFPSTEMHIVCPHCGIKGTVRKEYPPEQAFNITCPKCKQFIIINVNKRQFYRKKVKIEASYYIEGTSSPFKKGTIIDISTGGLRLRCYKTVSVHAKTGNYISLSFSLPPREDPIKVQGEIVTIIEETDKTMSFGLKFKNLSEFEETQIGFFLQA
ncbi:PilZ domain-containing protein [Candidatus Magnetominusculus xianensis]|uniref:PilZ domain-containing protein n=1 Tax=Candidatus Magnetominusculus xianensis TaxID=1748249 RepID=A0ABR5SF58_9BACT|nr:PilZ domain-containing protein [Candidatus Magnetominusculus xianensis]KWT85572.1 hypothetical protein ASN18_1706 [Candidatus Magnetominusculus xianensis]MBF0404197.1 PilZ domain-containing protein [Nitrospirota bacterium]